MIGVSMRGASPEMDQTSIVVDFVSRVEGAAALLTPIGFGRPSREAASDKPALPPDLKAESGWLSVVVRNATARLSDIAAFIRTRNDRHPVQATAFAAYRLLSELSPAGPQILELLVRENPRAYLELERQLDLIVQQYSEMAALLDRGLGVERAGTEDPTAVVDPAPRFAEVRDALLKAAGGAYSLTDAAKFLGVSRQAMHKKVVSGAALGMMRDDEIVVPKLQFLVAANKPSIIPGVREVTKLFKSAQAGGWATLQFLVDEDPNLRRRPIDALRDGALDVAINAASVYLNLDEGRN